MTTTTLGITLPVTRKIVGDDSIVVSSMQSMEGREGVAFNAKVRHKGKIIGAITDDGNGGGAWFRGNSREANEAWSAFVEATRAARGVSADDYLNGSEETIADDVVTEYEIGKLVRKANRTAVIADPGPGQPLEFYGMITVNAGPDAGTMAYLRSKPPIDGPMLYWDPAAADWVPVPT